MKYLIIVLGLLTLITNSFVVSADTLIFEKHPKKHSFEQIKNDYRMRIIEAMANFIINENVYDSSLVDITVRTYQVDQVDGDFRYIAQEIVTSSCLDRLIYECNNLYAFENVRAYAGRLNNPSHDLLVLSRSEEFEQLLKITFDTYKVDDFKITNDYLTDGVSEDEAIVIIYSKKAGLAFYISVTTSV